MTTDYITEEKRKALEIELAELKGPNRKEILDMLEYAKSLGDLKENAEYHQAREDQGKLEEKILKIERVLQLSEVVSGKGGKGDTVGIGSKVTVQKKDSKDSKMYIVVGSEEVNMSEGKISNRSPFGEALFGKKKGDKILFTTPGGNVEYIIVSIN